MDAAEDWPEDWQNDSERYYLVRTLGCKANLYDSQRIEAELQKRGWLPWGDRAGKKAEKPPGKLLCIVNSCAVTNEADRQTRKTAAKIAKDYPGAIVVVTGCSAEVDSERLANSEGIHYVIGNRDKPEIVDLILNSYQTTGSHKKDWPSIDRAFALPEVGFESFSRKTRVFLKIQDGCNAFCTYCIIPYARGPSRSLPIPGVLSQVERLVTDAGIREIVLTGTNIGDYGEGGLSLTELCERILGETSLERLRLSSLNPTEISLELLRLMEKDPRLCPHFHVSLQSPNTKILRRMKRHYGFEEVKDCLEKIHSTRPAGSAGNSIIGGVFVGMDVITGFPGESKEDFSWTCKVLEELPWTRLHVFPYSEREGTPAVKLPDSVSAEERRTRQQVLNTLSRERLQNWYSKILAECQATGQPLMNVLLEKQSEKDKLKHSVTGYTSNYVRVVSTGQKVNEVTRNHLIYAKPIKWEFDIVFGEAIMIACALDT